ncbi:uncharacterized protein AMSG_02819 [Thecamonas trahens ATCC 50062]|uniref:WRKY domain-containing protein n=1 Tax=Thecamonas trahens ATCC 50062 TaxID=461836 RepID=A0A0L0D257_THETB|nr:hypothetical protein AMSG_02819 [Thecamonas trahens ATCC 50062]KNC46367.1 hypothetical protein AMSG_02819 [Thecamonas trahens ATCC 50062]|eukprot:XP_013760660.1 hypothetical protein AMSG_02819 [Thecamonas trahens ATCC 50062]
MGTTASIVAATHPPGPVVLALPPPVVVSGPRLVFDIVRNNWIPPVVTQPAKDAASPTRHSSGGKEEVREEETGGGGDDGEKAGDGTAQHYWRKYGEKTVTSRPYPRSYYRCTHPGCPAKKTVDVLSRSPAGENLEVVEKHRGEHTHPPTTLADRLARTRRPSRFDMPSADNEAAESAPGSNPLAASPGDLPPAAAAAAWSGSAAAARLETAAAALERMIRSMVAQYLANSTSDGYGWKPVALQMLLDAADAPFLRSALTDALAAPAPPSHSPQRFFANVVARTLPPLEFVCASSTAETACPASKTARWRLRISGALEASAVVVDVSYARHHSHPAPPTRASGPSRKRKEPPM